jgi:beta-lactamase regulating signal transducer with metallopeptidase domain
MTRMSYFKKYIILFFITFLIANLMFSPVLNSIRVRKPDFLVYLYIILVISALFIILVYLLYFKIKGKMFSNTCYSFNMENQSSAFKSFIREYSIRAIYIHTISNGNISATGDLIKGTLNIYVLDKIYERLNEVELSLLILHEFAHIKFNHIRNMFIIYGSAFLLTFLSASIFVAGYLVQYDGYLTVFSFVYMCSLLVLFIPIATHNEIRADRFSIEVINNKEAMESLLNKSYAIAINPRYTPKQIRRMEKLKELRIARIEFSQ